MDHNYEEMKPMLDKDWEQGYTLHSEGPNWWHFRRYPDRMMQSFTITAVHDGTVVMTGDMGVMAVRRQAFPNHVDLFPRKGDHIGYFAEKIRVPDKHRATVEWSEDLARKEILECLIEYEKDNVETFQLDMTEEEEEKLITKIATERAEGILSELWFDNEYEMLDALTTWRPDDDWYDRTFGMTYTPSVVWAFHLMSYWAEFMVARKEKENQTKESD